MPTRNQISFQYGGRECECHYRAEFEVDRAEPQTHDYPGCPAYAHVNDVKLLFVETDEEVLGEPFKIGGLPCLTLCVRSYKRIEIPDLPDALVAELEKMAWEDATTELNKGEI